MQLTLTSTLDLIRGSLDFFFPEIILTSAIVLVIVIGLFKPGKNAVYHVVVAAAFLACLLALVAGWNSVTAMRSLFAGMVGADQFGSYFKILFALSGILTVVITTLRKEVQERCAEYYALILTICLGANLLVSSTNFVMAFLALELISIPSYVLTGFSFNKAGTEGSLKYFIFGSVASAFMLYGISLLYGYTGTLDFTGEIFSQKILHSNETLFLVGCLFTLIGFLYKVAASPLHPWAPDVYESAPMPIVAFFSVVPKLAGLAILARFIFAINQTGQWPYAWQMVVAGVSILTLTIGNFSALWQTSPKRLMAYSSIAQTGFMLVGIVVFPTLGLENLLFYATVFVILNYLVFIYLSYFESAGLTTMASYQGTGHTHLWPSIFLLVGLVGLTGLPPTAGFTAKLLIFSSLWKAFGIYQKSILLILLVFGLLNTVVSLFYYFRIPFYAFIRRGANVTPAKILTWENLFGVILVLVILLLFFSPGLLMGWINKITFVF